MRQLGLGLIYLGCYVFLNSLSVLKYLLHGIGSCGPMLLKHLGDLVDTSGQILNVSPLTESFSSPDQILDVVVFCEISIL